MKGICLVLVSMALPLLTFANSEDDSVRKAVAAYDQAVAKKDVEPPLRLSGGNYPTKLGGCETPISDDSTVQKSPMTHLAFLP